ncbi:MAG: hypothetical protein A2Y65_03865 [Deltaproteobacteria bacterium RBG_13_52_11]|nr:MAG: hypothetical protein A2Y65_03865 [Deltaproteobacteria bacterium RBG_13_52_11]
MSGWEAHLLTLTMEAKMFRSSFFLRLVSLTFFILLIGLASQVCAQENTFTYKDFSLSLPEGWSTQEIPQGSEKELIGSLKSDKISATTVLVFCYSSWLHSYSSVRIVGLKTIAASYPKGQEMLKKPTKMKTNGGYTAAVEFWKGAVDAGGLIVFLRSPMGIMETKPGWILMLGFTPDSSGDQLEEDFVKMIQSAK